MWVRSTLEEVPLSSFFVSPLQCLNPVIHLQCSKISSSLTSSFVFLFFFQVQMERSLADELYSDILGPEVKLSVPDIKQSHSQDVEDEQGLEDGSSWNGSDGEFDPSSDRDREWERIKNQFHSIGYRDGIIAGKEASAQEGFNVGFKESVVAGFNLGLVRGVTGALHCLPGELKEKIIESRETRNKFHDLYESVNNLSTTDALNLFCKRSIKPGEENSDDSVLDSYYEKLQSIHAESPAIEVQFRE